MIFLGTIPQLDRQLKFAFPISIKITLLSIAWMAFGRSIAAIQSQAKQLRTWATFTAAIRYQAFNMQIGTSPETPETHWISMSLNTTQRQTLNLAFLFTSRLR